VPYSRSKSRQKKKKVRDPDSWVTNWGRAQQRRFIASLEGLWMQEGDDLSPESPKGAADLVDETTARSA
jgi:hypothetical protein